MAMLAGEANIGRVPVKTLERHVTFIDAYRSEARATLIGVASFVTVAAVDVSGRSDTGLSVSVTADDIA